MPTRPRTRLIRLGLALVAAACLLLAGASGASADGWQPVVSPSLEARCPGTTALYANVFTLIDARFADGSLGVDAAKTMQNQLRSAVSAESQAQLDQLADHVRSSTLSPSQRSELLGHIAALDAYIPCVPLTGTVYVFNPGNPVPVIDVPVLRIATGW